MLSCQISGTIEKFTIIHPDSLYDQAFVSVLNNGKVREFFLTFLNKRSDFIGGGGPHVFAGTDVNLFKEGDNIVATLQYYNHGIPQLQNMQIGNSNSGLYCYSNFLEFLQEYIYYPIISIGRYFQYGIYYTEGVIIGFVNIILIVLILIVAFIFFKKFFKK